MFPKQRAESRRGNTFACFTLSNKQQMAEEDRVLRVAASKQSDPLNHSYITLEPLPSICPHPS